MIEGHTDQALSPMEEGTQMHMNCTAPATGSDDNAILKLYNGTNIALCQTPANTEGEMCCF